MTLLNEMNRKPGSNPLIGLLFSNPGSPIPLTTQVPVFFIGVGSILSQILLLREFLVSFYGNELSIGIVFACWLVWIGLGSLLGNVIVRRNRNVPRLFFVLIVISPLVTFIQILAVKFVRAFVSIAPGEFLSMLDLLGFSFAVLSLGCLVWGMLFTLGARLLTFDTDECWFGVNKAYVLESFGSVVGGLLFSFVLTTLFSILQTVFFIAVLAWCMVLWVVHSEKKWFVMLSAAGMIVVFVVLLQPIRTLEHRINTYQWSFMNEKLTFVRSIDTKYQNLSLLRLENQHTVYADGRPAYNIPNTYEAELLTHSIMVHRTNAKRVLVLGCGFNGVLREVLKYPVQDVVYIEIDPALLPFAASIAKLQDQEALRDSRVHLLFMDGREFMRGKHPLFDVIVMNAGEPSTASINRFYTEEFFRQCYQTLSTNGLFAFSFPSSAEYLADELKNLNASLYQTFTRVFAQTLIIPGTHAVLIGTTGTTPLISHPDSLALRYSAAGVSAEYFSKYMFGELMPPDRIAYVTHILETAADVERNTDRNPVAYFYDLLLWNKFLHGSSAIFSSITRFWIIFSGGIGSVLLMLLIVVQRNRPEKQKQTALRVIIAVCGMIGMALNLLLLLNFQETFGSIFEMIGAMIAANMAGLAFGALAASRLVRKYQQETLLLMMLIVLMGIVFLLPNLLDFLVLAQLVPITLSATIMSGGLIGMIFGIVNKLYVHGTLNGGSMYAFDVFGSSLGAFTTCSMLLPAAGIQVTAVVLSLPLAAAVVAAFLLRKHT